MSELQIYLLGPPAMSAGQRPWFIPRRQVRALIYRLAVDKAPLARAYLALLFWPEWSEGKARRNLTHLLTHARRSLPEPELLLTDAERVWLREDVWVDTVQLQKIRAGPPAGWLSGLELYRGEFLAGAELPANAEFELWLLQEQRRWERVYLELLGQLIEQETQTGAREAAIQHIRRYLKIDPLAEEMHARLMSLYVDIGARADALRQYERYVTLLDRELGVDPSPTLRAVYKSILHAQPLPSSFAPQNDWATLPSLQGPQIGRDACMAWLEKAFAAATAKEGNVCFIRGEAGIGKSRLLQEFAGQIQEQALVLYGVAAATRQPLPYQAIMQALRGALHRPELNALSPTWLAELRQLLPEVQIQHPNLPPPMALEPPQARMRLFEGLCQAFLALASDSRPLVVCLDDMHWADSATFDWLAYFGRRLRHARLLILLAYRPDVDTTIGDLARQLARHVSVHQMTLEGLPIAAVKMLLQHAGVFPTMQEELVEQLHAVTGGNPFFILEIARALLERRRQGTAVEFTWPLPESVSQVIISRLVSLTPAAIQMLEAGAVLADEFTFESARETAGREELEAIDGLDELVGRQLLTHSDGVYRFIHDLTRRVVLARMSPVRMRLLHRRAALALVRQRSLAMDVIAQHFDAGGDAEMALTYYQAAAERAEKLCAWQAAESYYERMLDLLAQIDPEHQRQSYKQQHGRILTMRAHMHFLQGRLAQRDADVSALMTLAQATHDKALLLMALVARVRYLNLDGLYQEALAETERGIALATELADMPTLSQLWAQKGFAHYFLGQPHPALEALQQAGAAAAQLDDPKTHGRIAQFTGYVYYHLSEYEQALAQHMRALSYHEAADDRNRLAWDRTDIGIMCMELQRLEEAEAQLRASLQLAREIASQPAESYALNNLGRLHTLRGNYLEALHCHETSLQLQRATGSKRGETTALIGAARIKMLLGESETAARMLRMAIDICTEIGYQSGLVEALSLLALSLQEHNAAALSMAQSALVLARQIACPKGEISAALTLARLYLYEGRSAMAQEMAQQALKLARRQRLKADAVWAQVWLGLAHMQKGETEPALAHAQKAYETLEAEGLAIGADEWVYLAYSRALAAGGCRTEAASLLLKARAAFWRKARRIPDGRERQGLVQRWQEIRRWTASLL